MRFKNILLLLTLIISTINGLAQVSEKDIVYKWESGDIENKIIMLILNDSITQKFIPSINEIKLAKELSINYIDSLEKNRNYEVIKKYGKILKYKHKNYYRQYAGYINTKGEKIIIINACCSEFKQHVNLEKNWLLVMDGGSCFFKIKVNIQNKRCHDFSVNGEA
ncbi:MAG: hypothetical protein ACOYO1_20400 [Bacteroidales bacterium]